MVFANANIFAKDLLYKQINERKKERKKEMKTPKILKNINQESIGYLESSINYTYFYLQDGKSIISSYNIKVFENLLNNVDFIKINRSNLVNVSFIQKILIERNTCSIQLINGDTMNISRRRLKVLKEKNPLIVLNN
jgi:two-component system LytT family response regulator